MRPLTHPIARFLLHLGLSLVALVSTLPFVWTLLNSFKTRLDAQARVPQVIFDPTLESYSKVLLDSVPDNGALVGIGLVAVLVTLLLIGKFAKRIPFPTKAIYCVIAVTVGIILWGIPRVVDTAGIYDNFISTVIIAIGTVIVSIAIGSPAAYALARYTGISGIVILLAAIAFRSLPRLGYILPYFQVGQMIGLHDTYFLLIIVLVAVNQPFVIWMLRAFFLSVPREIEDAAMVDGASRFMAFRRVVIPVVWPGIVATSLFTLLVVYYEFLLIRILSQSNQTLTVAMTQFLGGVSVAGSIPRQSAAAVVSVLPLMVVVLILQKQFVAGIGEGAVKG